MPEGSWSFDGSVAECFDDMLARCIPQYDVMRDAVFRVASSFVRKGHDIIDLGSSRGEALRRLIDRHGACNRYVAVEVSEPMLEVLRTRFAGYIDAGIVVVDDTDLRVGFPNARACVVQSILTLMFVPIEHRQRVLRDIYESLIPGGALVVVEKVLGRTSQLNDLMVDAYLDLKKDNGYTYEQIERKKASLEGVLVPMTAQFDEELFYDAGFVQVDCFWRWMNFAAWVCVR